MTMLEFMMMLERKLPAGFTVSFHRTHLGFKVEFRYGLIAINTVVNDEMLEDDMEEKTKRQFDQLVIDDYIRKIRKHPFFRIQKMVF